MACSGPPRGTAHTYALVDDIVPTGPDDALDRDKARVRMVRRFFAGYGPVGGRDLLRWSTLTLTEIRIALSVLGGVLEPVEVDGSTLWFDPEVAARTSREHAAYLLPTFDEAHLTYAQVGFPRPAVASERARLVAEGGGGIVVVDGHDIGTFTRRVRGVEVEVVLRGASGGRPGSARLWPRPLTGWRRSWSGGPGSPGPECRGRHGGRRIPPGMRRPPASESGRGTQDLGMTSR